MAALSDPIPTLQTGEYADLRLQFWLAYDMMDNAANLSGLIDVDLSSGDRTQANVLL